MTVNIAVRIQKVKTYEWWQKDIYNHEKEPHNTFMDNKVKKAIERLRKCHLLYVNINRVTKWSALKPLSKL